MTAEDPPRREERPFPDAIFVYGFQCILAAGGREAAGRRGERRYAVTVKLYGQAQPLRHEPTELLHRLKVLPPEGRPLRVA